MITVSKKRNTFIDKACDVIRKYPNLNLSQVAEQLDVTSNCLRVNLYRGGLGFKSLKSDRIKELMEIEILYHELTRENKIDV